MDDNSNDDVGDVRSSDRRPRIKPVSRITSSTYSRLKSAQCFPEIDRRLRLGWSPNDLAHAIHEEFEELTTTPVKYLRKLIERYRSSIPPAELSMMSSNSLVSRLATNKVSNGIDELNELEKLYAMQMERIEIDLQNEKKIGKLLNSTGNEIFIAMKLLKQSADLKMDLGLNKRQLGTFEMTGKMAAEIGERYGNDKLGQTVADPNSRRKVLNFAERLMALTERSGIDVISMIDVEAVEKAPETDQSQGDTESTPDD